MTSDTTHDAQPLDHPHVGDVSFTYATVQPDRWTFGADKIRAWVERFLEGCVLNACAGETVLNHKPIHRNDVDPDVDADTYLDVRALPDELDTTFDAIVYDPPFTPHQAAATYDQSAPGYGTEVVDALHALLRPGGRVLTFGYSTWGMPADRGYRHEAVGLFNTLGRQHDYLGVVSRHAPDASSPATACRTASVRANAVAPADHDYEDQPEGTIKMSYSVCEQDAWLETTSVRHWVETYLQGRALVVYDRPGVNQLAHQPLLLNASPDSEADGETVDMCVDPTALSDSLSQVVQSVVFAPPSAAFQATTEYRGNETGLSTAVKRELHEVLEPGGQVIQLGHTASCMRSDFGYEREAVGIFARPGDEHDVVGAVDRKRTNDLTDLMRQSGTTYERCKACFAEWTILDPAFRVGCPLCGATAAHRAGPHLHGGEYCLSPDGTVPNAGTALEGIHWARIRAARERLDDLGGCPATDTGIHDRRTDHPVRFQPIVADDI